ncbi:MAG: hypothetical protein QN131_00065 [Armatimonadota bacterium]|nr:hypothetical protein [Armatimonadota bacterium]MDR7548319.1 hypothetical protein [Armatimonadota bacterium]
MAVLRGAWDYALRHQDRFWRAVATHAELSLLALAAAALLAIGTGILLSRHRRAAFVVVNAAAMGRTIPILASWPCCCLSWASGSGRPWSP